MVAMLEDRVLDLGLNVLDIEATHIYICGAEPTTYSIAVTSGVLGYKSFTQGSVFGAPGAGTAPTGRKVTSVSVSDGTITTSGTAQWWAVVDSTSTRLLAHGSLSATQVVTAGNTFTLAAFDIKMANQ